MIYQVQYVLDGKRAMKAFEAPNVGAAFFKCMNKFGGCTLVSAHLHSKIAGCEMWMDYLPPSMAKVEPLEGEKREQSEMAL